MGVLDSLAHFSKWRHERYRRIVEVLAKHGLNFLIPRKYILRYLPLTKRLKAKLPKERERTPEEKARVILEELGPTYIKLGQVLSTRKDVIPPKFAKEFEKLTDKAPPFSFSEAKRRIEEEYGRPLEEVFQSFEKEPIAAASLGQVHKATLENGDEVVVKVQRPNIKRIIKADVYILRQIAKLAEDNVSELKQYQPKELVEEYKKTVTREINYMREARNTEKVRKNFEDNPHVVIPKVYWDYTTKRVIVTELLKGEKLTEWIAKDPDKEVREKIAQWGTDAFLQQIFVDGLFQADPHVGNFLIIDDERIGLIDLGMVDYLDEGLKNRIRDIFLGIVNEDAGKIVKQLIRVGVIDEKIDRTRLRMDVTRVVKQYYDISLSNFSMQELADDIHGLLREYSIKVPPSFMLLLKTLGQVESIGREIDPDYNFVQCSKPYLREIAQRDLSVESLTEKVTDKVIELSELASDFPRRLDYLMWLMEQGHMTIEFEHKGLEGVLQRFHEASDKLSISMILAALIIASALIVSSGFQTLGMIAFLIGGIVGIIWVIKLLTS